jgi:tRNA(Leu) C34 or U34 (ribose-2'-O)-methylase TrmL
MSCPCALSGAHRAERLDEFVHPENAVYVFGPEDGGVPKGARHVCHRFVCIPTLNDGPLNLAAAVNVVLYDRLAKRGVGAR